MLILGETTVWCDGKACGERFTFRSFPTIDTKTEAKQAVKKEGRARKWVFTRDGHGYCPNCAKKLHLRNGGKINAIH